MIKVNKNNDGNAFDFQVDKVKLNKIRTGISFWNIKNNLGISVFIHLFSKTNPRTII